jgi:tetratricopeptide (TPR) repeat protein
LARDQGDDEVAWQVVADLLPDGPRTAPGNTAFAYVVPLHRLAAQLALDSHDLATARAWLEAHDYWLEWSGAVLGQAEAALGWAQYHHTDGDAEQARIAAEQAFIQASDPRQPLALLAIHRFLGQLDVAAAHIDAAEAHLQESLRLADACAAPFERALTLLGMAELGVAQGRWDEARALLDEVRIICEPLGARPTLERVATLEQLVTTPEVTDA